MFVIGVLYLTSDSYDYTFSSFNSTMVSGIPVSFGIVISILALVNIIFLQILLCRAGKYKYYTDSADAELNSKFTFCTGILISFCSGFILILLIVLLAIGIWGLVVFSNNTSLANEVRNNLINAFRNYITNGSNDQTKSIDWVQSKFECCGIDRFFSSFLSSL